jgi:protein-L-isoaspartate O-methyltransferase
MPQIVGVHDVEDVDRWLSYKAERAEAIEGVGGTNVVDHVADDGSKTIAVTADVSDLAAFKAAMQAPPDELLATMQRHGVVPPVRWFVQG